MNPKITYNDLDWHRLWQNARELKSWTAKGPADWDKKAASFAVRNTSSPYVELVLQRLPLDKATSVLDAGSGPGTLSIPLARQVQSVTALDYSRGMLDVLEKLSHEQDLDNITTVLASWDDDWKKLGIKQHDICIASRSLSVDNLRAALRKLNSYARSYVFIADRISPTPFDPDAFRAIGRPFRSGPDYIYTINTLYSMGIHACVDIISLEAKISFDSIETALESYTWMFKELTAKEEKKLQNYIISNSAPDNNGNIILNRTHPPRWALIWWKKEA
ncbi:MAG: class I SAM-dependent methyltransferase [Proteobacteria bacterium]|nr:class I SAM-dependent methyltransferase [Pseudomonadota bacterium]MBU1138408.1 class I SAM-dependent methyltransferase [Pseudomonadota bacterium]